MRAKATAHEGLKATIREPSLRSWTSAWMIVTVRTEDMIDGAGGGIDNLRDGSERQTSSSSTKISYLHKAQLENSAP